MTIDLAMSDVDAWYRDCRIFPWSGNDIVYRDRGDGAAACLLVHGFPTASCDWIDITAGIDGHFRCLAPDLLDYGRSNNPSARRWHIHDQADMLEALVAELGLSDVHLIVHDVGDTVGQELLARHNEGSLGFSITSMVLMNGGIFPAEHRPRPVQKLLLSPVGPLLARLLGRDRFMAALAEVFGENTRPGPEATDALWNITIGVNGRASLTRRIHYMNDRVLNEARWVGALREATIPMLMINGVDDPISGGHVCDVLEREVPQMRIARLDSIGHFPPLEAPGDCVRLILDFHGIDRP